MRDWPRFPCSTSFSLLRYIQERSMTYKQEEQRALDCPTHPPSYSKVGKVMQSPTVNLPLFKGFMCFL